MYESLIASAQRFYVFMCDLFSTGQAVRNKLCMLDDRELPYREVVVVTHSMGSVVVRKAMVEADEDKHPWTRQVSLVLYAPAHLGARVVRYISQSLDSTLLRPLVPLLKYKCQPIDELKPNSELLKTLAQEVTDRLKADPEKRFLIARRVIHAYGDNVVLKRDKRFCLDPKATWIEGDHFSISKPANDSSEPLLQLLAALGDADGR